MHEIPENNSPLPLGEILRNKFGGQSQYLVRYFIRGIENNGYEYLGEGLRIAEKPDYHEISIHPDDAAEAIRRFGNILSTTETKNENITNKDISRKTLLNEDLPDWLK